MLSSHSNDPPSDQQQQHGQNINVIDGAIDPSLIDNAESAKLPDDDTSLKRTWLTLLPIEQVIEIIMKLDENIPKTVSKEVWPTDLKAAVLRAAVAKIVESSGKGSAQDVLTSLDSKSALAAPGTEHSTEIVAVQNGVSSMGGEPPRTTTASNAPPLPTPVPTAAATASKSPPPATANSVASPSLVPSTTPVPPLTSTIPRISPATSTTPYQASSSFSTYTYPYASGSYSYPHSANHQPYSYTYTPSAGSTSYSPAPSVPRVPIPPTPAVVPVPEDEDDLPSYEEMLVQALTVHNDPEGTAPKQLFQWMAATYPLQANFRPSASQALQKAFKRGRFEKNNEGRYRLNPRWEGGNTSRRATRRPQSYSKAVLNPSPSSHPPPNTSQYPSQHYTWTYGAAGRSVKSQSPVPPTPSPTPLPPPLQAQPQPIPVNGAVALSTSGEGEQDRESHRSCMEAAYSILEALNLTSMTNVGEDRGGGSLQPTTGETAIPAAQAQGPTNSATLSLTAVLTLPLPTSTTAPLAITETSSQSVPNRSALQGSLALLAAQLAELADGEHSKGSASVPTEVPVSASVANTLNLLEGIGLDVFTSNAWPSSLQAVDVESNR